MASQKSHILIISLTVFALIFSNKLVLASFKTHIPETSNWTSCEEFVNNTVFDAEKVLNIDWQIFFFWNPEIEETYNIRFSRPADSLVDRFRKELDKEIKPPVNWTNADLFMETGSEFSALFIKTNQSGVFRIIPAAAFDYAVHIPMLIFALKVVEPGYLGISNCRYRICYALAPVDKMPYHYELEKAAKLLNFYNPYNRSHIALPRASPSQVPLINEPDDQQDEDLEVDADPNAIRFI